MWHDHVFAGEQSASHGDDVPVGSPGDVPLGEPVEPPGPIRNRVVGDVVHGETGPDRVKDEVEILAGADRQQIRLGFPIIAEHGDVDAVISPDAPQQRLGDLDAPDALDRNGSGLQARESVHRFQPVT